MIVNEIRPYSEAHGTLSEKFFGVADLGSMFEILRTKLYSNPVLAVCREIASNGRDTMRAVNKQDKPIQIHLPSGLEPFFSVKDWGEGISPDRMENIFSNYGASTKRNDNIQTGYFGLGFKSFFSTSDSASVITVFDGIEYHYACYIDETKIGKVALLSKKSVDAMNGTEVKIPVKASDFHLFKQYTEQACRHWDIKPIIHGSQIKWQLPTKIIEGSNWFIATDSGDSSYYNTGNAKLLIDQIEYPLEMDALKKYADPKLINACKGTLYLSFSNGDLSLSANRENIYLDKPTQEKIRIRLEEVIKEIKTQVEAKINAFPNLWDANIYYRNELKQAFNDLSFLGKLSWNGYPVNANYRMDAKCSIYLFEKGKYSHRYGNDPNKIMRSFAHDIEFSPNSALYVNDLSIKDPTSKHVKKAFEADPNLKYVQVICPNDARTEADLNKDIHLDQMAPKRLSSITKASARKYTPSANRLLVFKSESGGNFRQVSYDDMDKDTDFKVLCMLVRNNYSSSSSARDVILSNKQKLNYQAVKSLIVKFPQTSFYGVDTETDPKRIKQDLSDLMPMEKFFDSKVFSKAINYTEIKWATENVSEVDDRLLQHLDKLEKLITNKASPFLERLHLHSKVLKLSKEENGLLYLYEVVKGKISQTAVDKFSIDHPELNVGRSNKEYNKRYPLLGMMNSYYLSDKLEALAQYVNLIDKT